MELRVANIFAYMKQSSLFAYLRRGGGGILNGSRFDSECNTTKLFCTLLHVLKKAWTININIKSQNSGDTSENNRLQQLGIRSPYAVAVMRSLCR